MEITNKKSSDGVVMMDWVCEGSVEGTGVRRYATIGYGVGGNDSKNEKMRYKVQMLYVC